MTGSSPSHRFRPWRPEARRSFHRRSILACAPRLLSSLNRCPISASSGSFDREYWGWCTKDFANQDLQRATLLLAWLYITPPEDTGGFPDNPFHQEDALLTWARQAIGFWLHRQAAGGGFDHLYPLEKSWMAAAFTLVDMIGAWDMLAPFLDEQFQKDWLVGMCRAGHCLLQRDENHGFISNHRAGAAAGLLGLARLTGDACYSRRALYLLEGVLHNQSSEGFFLEYEGADPGYETLGLHYLSKCHAELTRAGHPAAGRLKDAVEKSLGFISYWVHPDGSLGGEYGSRACPQVFPGGLEYWACSLPVAEAIAGHTTRALACQQAAGLADSDIRNEIPLLSSVIAAVRTLDLISTDRPMPIQMPFERSFERIWPGAGLYLRSEPMRYLVFGASKGAVVRLYVNGELRHTDCGYTAMAGRLGLVTTHIWQIPLRFVASGLAPGSEHSPRAAGIVEAEVCFIRFNPAREMTPFGLMAFRLFSVTVGRWQYFNEWARKLIIRLFLTGKANAGITLQRSVRFDTEGVHIEDTLHNPRRRTFARVCNHGFFAAVYMASARYFRMGDLRQCWTRECGTPSDGDVLQRRSIGSPGQGI